jgi:hypothetical protein
MVLYLTPTLLKVTELGMKLIDMSTLVRCVMRRDTQTEERAEGRTLHRHRDAIV